MVTRREFLKTSSLVALAPTVPAKVDTGIGSEEAPSRNCPLAHDEHCSHWTNQNEPQRLAEALDFERRVLSSQSNHSVVQNL